MYKVLIILNMLFLAVTADALQCSSFLIGDGSPASRIVGVIDSVRAKRAEVSSAILASGISSQSVSTLNTYYDLIDPSSAVQNISNEPVLLTPFVEDMRLSSLPIITTDKMLQLMRSKLFRPLEALVVAKYLTSASQTNHLNMVAADLINLRVDELVLIGLRRQLVNDELQSNARLKIKEYELKQIEEYLLSSSRLFGLSTPRGASRIRSFVISLNVGSFISPELERHFENIYSRLF